MFPSKAAIKRAGRLQAAVRNEERESLAIARPEDVALATVNGREDLVMIYSLLASTHGQLVTISRGVWFLGFAIMMAVFSLAGR